MKASKVSGQKKPTRKLNYLDAWKKITSSPDFHEALIKHFSYLADSPGYAKVLSRVMKEATSVKISGKNLEVIFSEKSMIATPPLDKIPKYYPKSFAALLQKHETLTFYRTLGEHKKFDLSDGWFNEPEYLNARTKPFVGVKNLICPIADPDGDFWIYHPKKKKPDGAPVICFLDHESGEVGKDEKTNAGSVFLKSCASFMQISLDSKSRHKAVDEREWWNSLDNDWKTYFRQNPASYYSNSYYPNPNVAQIRQMMAPVYVYIEANSKIKTLQPLRGMTKLKRLSIWSPTKFNFSPLLALTELEILSLNGTSISSLDVLKNMTKLTELSLFRSSTVSSLKPLGNMRKLKELDVSYTDVVDISSLSSLKSLRELSIMGTGVKEIKSLHKLPLTLLKIEEAKVDLISFIEFRRAYKTGELSSSFGWADYLVKALESADFKKVLAIKIPLGEFLIEQIEYHMDYQTGTTKDNVDKLINVSSPYLKELPKVLQIRFEQLKDNRALFKKNLRTRKN